MKHVLQELLEDLDFGVRPYSGLDTHGRACLGMILPEGVTMGMLMADIVERLGDMDVASHDEAAKAFRRMRTDTWRRGQFVYFPGVEWAGAAEKDA